MILQENIQKMTKTMKHTYYISQQIFWIQKSMYHLDSLTLQFEKWTDYDIIFQSVQYSSNGLFIF